MTSAPPPPSMVSLPEPPGMMLALDQPVMERGEGTADGLIGIAEIDDGRRLQNQRVDAGATVDRGFRTVIDDAVIAGAGGNDIRAAAAVDGGVARTRRDSICRRRAGHGQGRAAGG